MRGLGASHAEILGESNPNTTPSRGRSILATTPSKQKPARSIHPRHPSSPRPQPESRRADVARRLGVAKSTAHRLLTMLRSRGLAEEKPAIRQAKPRRPTRCSSAGKAIAAFDPALAAARFPPRTDTTTCTASDFEQAPAQCAAPVTPPTSVRRSSAGAAVAARAPDRSGRACAAVSLVT
ncbi:helix-turn-helix domain-containing protein [Streptomyces sp. 3213.3]|uniref:helix-turn-helix domain-containing protein n=1 Tax=Streptomyces sp. 3213.3 TaxID=1855348 RepID=UPI0022866574|nr:helix-turn-helix domain-containing protein [Streptomyces sp. 3213.3]